MTLQTPEDIETLSLLKKEREDEIRKKLVEFFRMTAVNIITDEGVSLSIDSALHINRQKIIGEIMVEIGEELQKDENFIFGNIDAY